MPERPQLPEQPREHWFQTMRSLFAWIGSAGIRLVTVAAASLFGAVNRGSNDIVELLASKA